MLNLAKGQRFNTKDNFPGGVFRAGLELRGLPVDFACFGLDSAGKLSDERYMTFFNQPRTPCAGMEVFTSGSDDNVVGFNLSLNKLPAHIERVVVCASSSGDQAMSAITSGHLTLIDISSNQAIAGAAFSGSDFAQEKALMLGEFYRKEGTWRFMVVGQGFNGGLDALVRHFGGAVEESAPEPQKELPAQSRQVSLEKRVAQQAPQLVSLVKKAGVSLEKVGLADHKAKVCLCLDISGSMGAMYRKGLVQQFAERVLALACKFDDDGDIDVFLFGANVHQPHPMGLSNWKDYISNAIKKHPLEGDTRYGKAMEAIRAHYFPDVAGKERKDVFKGRNPVYVMFITDGSTTDKPLTEKQMLWSSKEPIFWQFMGIGKGRKSKSKLLQVISSSDFPFLESLDDMPGRLVDNADYFSSASPDEFSDEELYDLMMSEYPGWLKAAKQKNILY